MQPCNLHTFNYKAKREGEDREYRNEKGERNRQTRPLCKLTDALRDLINLPRSELSSLNIREALTWKTGRVSAVNREKSYLQTDMFLQTHLHAHTKVQLALN